MSILTDKVQAPLYSLESCNWTPSHVNIHIAEFFITPPKAVCGGGHPGLSTHTQVVPELPGPLLRNGSLI